MKKFIVALLTAILVISSSVSSVTAYACDPGRVNDGLDVWAEKRMSAQSGVVFHQVYSGIEIDRTAFTEASGFTNQYIQLYDNNGNYVRFGVNYTNGKAVRVFVQAPGLTKYYVQGPADNFVGLKIVRSTSSSYLLYDSGVYVDSVLFGSGWTPVHIKATVFTSTRGNQIPGHHNVDVARFTDPTYTTQYGTAAFNPTTFYVSQFSNGDPSFPGGKGRDSTGWYTYDHC